MPATVPLKAFLESNSAFTPGWRLYVNGSPMPLDTDWRVLSEKSDGAGGVISYGGVYPVVVPGERPYDRPLYHEASAGQTILHARFPDGKTRLGFIIQERPHADAPGEENQQKANAPVAFLTCLMGFANTVRGKVEDALTTALRELNEEAGAAKVLQMWVHAYGQNPTPSFTSTWLATASIEIDVSTLVRARHDPDEPILDFVWLTVREYKDALVRGYVDTAHGRRAHTGHGVSIAAVQIFLSAHLDIEREAFDEA